MMYSFSFLSLISTAIHNDITNYSLGLRFYLSNKTDISKLSQNQILSKGAEMLKNAEMSLLDVLFMKNEYDDRKKKHMLANLSYSRLADTDINFILSIDSGSPINSISPLNDISSLNSVSNNLMLTRMTDLDFARMDIKSLIKKRFGYFEAAYKIPEINAKRYKFDRMCLNFSFDKINPNLVDTSKVAYTLEEIKEIYKDLNSRVSNLIILYTIKNCQTQSGYPYNSTN
ncbi:hypothetical protein P3W45_000786 [Vairimorpha bombi]|jgi:hypothetical protein